MNCALVYLYLYSADLFICLAKNTSEHGFHFRGAFTSSVHDSMMCPDSYSQKILYYGLIRCEIPLKSRVKSNDFFTSDTGLLFCPIGYKHYEGNNIVDLLVGCIRINDCNRINDSFFRGSLHFGSIYPLVVEEHYIGDVTYYLVGYKEQVPKMNEIVASTQNTDGEFVICFIVTFSILFIISAVILRK